jgi:hypothetical protein
MKFKPRYSPEIELKPFDQFNFQWSGVTEDGDHEMYNNCGQVLEIDGKLYAEWNGGHYPLLHFLRCDHLDGDFAMDAIKIV